MVHAAAAAGGRLDAFVVRKQAKSHGLQRQIEGTAVEGRKVLLVEDTSTTGGSVLTAAEAVADEATSSASLSSSTARPVRASGSRMRATPTVPQSPPPTSDSPDRPNSETGRSPRPAGVKRRPVACKRTIRLRRSAWPRYKTLLRQRASRIRPWRSGTFEHDEDQGDFDVLVNKDRAEYPGSP